MDFDLLSNTEKKIRRKRFLTVVGPKTLFGGQINDSLVFAKVPNNFRESLEGTESKIMYNG